MKTAIRNILIASTTCLLAACGGDGPSTITGGGDGGGENVLPTSPSGRTGNFFDDIEGVIRRISRNLDPDRIPALTHPVFVDANSPEAAYVRETDPVLGLFINGEARAYPHNIGWLHEITNDVIGGQNVIVSFCPLTGTGMVHDGTDTDGSD